MDAASANAGADAASSLASPVSQLCSSFPLCRLSLTVAMLPIRRYIPGWSGLAKEYILKSHNAWSYDPPQVGTRGSPWWALGQCAKAQQCRLLAGSGKQQHGLR